MAIQVLFAFGLTLVIHLISTLSYSVRLVGVRTGRIAVSFALFNILALVSRLSNTLQAPLLARHVENSLNSPAPFEITEDFRLVLFAATIGTLLGAVLIPSFQKIFARAVGAFAEYRSIPKLIVHSFSRAGITHIKDSIKVPAKIRVSDYSKNSGLPWKIILFNTVSVALLTASVLAALYAGILIPELRVTASSLSGIVAGFSTVLILLVVDPYLSILTDEVIEGKVDEAFFRKCVISMVGSRILGTLLAQVLFIPGAQLIAYVASLL